MRVYMHTGGGEHVYSRFSEQGPETAPLGAWPVQPPHTNPDQILDILHFFSEVLPPGGQNVPKRRHQLRAFSFT